MAIPVLLSILKDLEDEEFSEFKWYLLNGGLTENTIAKGDLNNADRLKVVDLMVQKYTYSEAQKITIKALESISQNVLADKLRKNLPEVPKNVPAGGGSSPAVRTGPAETTAHQRDQVDGRYAPVPEEEPLLIKSDWRRPNGIIPCSQETKDRLLRENRDDIYIPKEKSQRTRLALLITNIHFADKSNNRDGAEKDEKNMEWLLEALGYTVVKHRNLTGKEMENAVKNFAARPEHHDSDSTFVVIMSHGDTIQNKDAILGVRFHSDLDNQDVFFVNDIFFHLNSVNCPALIDKPKVILIQACRGDVFQGWSQTLEDIRSLGLNLPTPDLEEQKCTLKGTDPVATTCTLTGGKGGVAIKSDAIIHTEKDFVSFKATLPGVCAFRTGANGSFFICYIVQVFSKCAHADEIRELFRKVASCMERDPLFETAEVDGQGAKIMPCVDRESLPKKFYLFPGL